MRNAAARLVGIAARTMYRHLERLAGADDQDASDGVTGGGVRGVGGEAPASDGDCRPDGRVSGMSLRLSLRRSVLL